MLSHGGRVTQGPGLSRLHGKPGPNRSRPNGTLSGEAGPRDREPNAIAEGISPTCRLSCHAIVSRPKSGKIRPDTGQAGFNWGIFWGIGQERTQ